MTPLHEPNITEEDIQSVSEALRSQWVSTGGPCIDEFEKKIAGFTGHAHAIAVCNGTVGLVLALDILKRKCRYEHGFCALVPTLSFAATWNSVIQAGGVPVPADCAAGNVNVSVETIQMALASQFELRDGHYFHKHLKKPLLCVLPAHILGWAYDIENIAEICQNMGVDLIEDAAESLGSFYRNGQHVGHHGQFSVLSFNGNKILTTGGGGMLLTNDESFAKRAKHLSTTAKTDNLRFVHDEPGYNFRMVNILAALGLSQFSRLQKNLDKKREIYLQYENHLKGSNAALYHQENCKPNNWINTVQFPTTELRETALHRLQSAGFDCRPLWTPYHRLPYSQTFGSYPGGFKNAEAMWNTMLSLPSSPGLTRECIEKICSVLKRI